jgi:glycosyltransferase involved in cell wall biosynthesis
MLKISIITVAFNSANTIADTMRSVAAQHYGCIEHIIIDGASSDSTLGIVSQFATDSTIVRSEPDKGIYDAMNKGLKMASGDVVGFLNSDDVFADPRSLATIANALVNPEIDACYGDLIYVSHKNPTRVIRHWKSRIYETGLCEKGWMPAHPTFYARKSVYEEFGDFDTDLKLQADFEMALRLLDIARIKTTYIPQVLVKMRTGGASNANLKNVIRGNLEASKACKKHGLRGGVFFILRKVGSRLPQFWGAFKFN